MKVAIVGSRNLCVIGLENFLPKNVTEIVSGGARGVDTCVREYAQTHGIKLTEYLPDYSLYSPLLQNAIKMTGRNFVCQGGGGKHTVVW